MMHVGDIVVYHGQHSPWRVFGLHTRGRAVSIELVRDPKHIRYLVPMSRLRLTDESRNEPAALDQLRARYADEEGVKS